MKRSVIILAAAAAMSLVSCSQSQTSSQSSSSPDATTAQPETSVTASSTPTTATASPTATKAPTQPAENVPNDKNFCAYLKKTQGAQQQVEDPAQFVTLIQGAAMLAPGAISEDAALYAESAQQLALTVTGTPKEAAKADKWLTANQAAIDQAEANLNSYSESTCGVPFIAGGQ